jgi:hypothetical protein
LLQKSIMQPCNKTQRCNATLQRNNHATLQHNNHATFNATITQPCNTTITQPLKKILYFQESDLLSSGRNGRLGLKPGALPLYMGVKSEPGSCQRGSIIIGPWKPLAHLGDHVKGEPDAQAGGIVIMKPAAHEQIVLGKPWTIRKFYFSIVHQLKAHLIVVKHLVNWAEFKNEIV